MFEMFFVDSTYHCCIKMPIIAVTTAKCLLFRCRDDHELSVCLLSG